MGKYVQGETVLRGKRIADCMEKIFYCAKMQVTV
jgi:hypothetical protein